MLTFEQINIIILLPKKHTTVHQLIFYWLEILNKKSIEIPFQLIKYVDVTQQENNFYLYQF